MAVMITLVVSIVYVFVISQRKKVKYFVEMQRMREEQQNMLIEAAIRSEESERHRIAEELHDEVGAMLSATKLHFSAIQHPDLSPGSADLLQRSKVLLNESILKVRSISHNLHSSILKELGLHEAIRHFVQTTLGSSGWEVEVSLKDELQPALADSAITVYRLVQELINNIMKHSNANVLRINNHAIPEGYGLHIVHNGTGLLQDEFEEKRYSETGLGLKNIQNRIILLRGSIHFTRQTDGMYLIDLQIPNQASHENN